MHIIIHFITGITHKLTKGIHLKWNRGDRRGLDSQEQDHGRGEGKVERGSPRITGSYEHGQNAAGWLCPVPRKKPQRKTK